MPAIDEHGGWGSVIGALIAGHDLSADEATAAMSTILAGDASDAQIAGFVVALRAKGETSTELQAMLAAALASAATVPLTEEERATTTDVVGTGGDGSNSINVSTMAALVAAGAGLAICKHGNRSASSQAGTADVLELLGVRLEQSPEGVAACVREAGIGFCFAPAFHPAFRFAGPARREMGIPTAFNLLGPMANPARVKRQLIGVAEPRFARPMIDALRSQGLISAWVVHGSGLDELTTTGTTHVLALADGEVTEFDVDPGSLGLAPASLDDLRGGTPAENVSAVRRVLGGTPGPHREIVVLNAAAALVVGGIAADLETALGDAAAAIDDGRASAVLDSLAAVSNAQARPDR